MLWGAHIGSLELRTEGAETRLRATFPYGQETVMVKGQAIERREVFAPRAFSGWLDSGEDVHFLSGHDFNKPLASRAAGTLTLTDTESALVIDATISADLTEVSYVRDFLGSYRAGLVRGLSPGFRVSPGGERVERRGDAIVRTVTEAELREISAVVLPQYPQAQIEARSWAYMPAVRRANFALHVNRWR